MAINVGEIDALTKTKIMPGLVDLFFKGGWLLQYLKRNRYKTMTGPEIQEPFLFKPMKGTWVSKGGNFDISKRQTKSGLRFDPKVIEVNVTEYLEDLEIIFKDPTSGISLLDADMANAALTMSAKLAVAIYRHGQQIGAVDRSLAMNGLEEALTDGTNATWSTAAPGFTNYGKQDRTDANLGNSLQSPTGQIASPAINGQITYRILEQTYQSCVRGEYHPMIGTTTNRCMGYINENFQPQQRIDTTDPVIGFTGIKFKAATIVADQYAPGQDITQQDIDELDAARPASGETFWWLNPGEEGDKALINLYFSDSEVFQFGWTGFKDAQDSIVYAGQILAGLNLTVRSPLVMRVLHGITG